MPGLLILHFTLQGQRPPAQSRKTGENLNILLQQCWSEAPPHTCKRLRSSGPIADKPGSSAAWQVPTSICALGTVTYTASQLSPRSKAACSRPHGANVTDSFALLPYFHYPQTEWSSATDQKPMGATASARETSSRVRKWSPQAPAYHVQRQGIFLYSTGSAAHSPGAASFVRVQVTAGAPKKWAMPSQDWQGRGGCQRVPDGIGLHSTETRPGRAASEKGRAFVCSGG